MAPYQHQECQKKIPESEETQKGHMRNQRQGVLYTKKPNSHPIEKRKDIYITTYNLRDKMFSDQTGKFPRSSSKRNNYQMIFHEIYGNSNFIEPTNNRTEDEIILS